MSGVKLIAGNCLIILQCHLVWQTLEREGSITITYLLQSQPISHPSLNWNRRPRMTRPSSKTAHIAVKRWVWVRVCVEICDILTLLRNRFVITSMLLCLYCLISSLQTDNKLTAQYILKAWKLVVFEAPTVTVWCHIKDDSHRRKPSLGGGEPEHLQLVVGCQEKLGKSLWLCWIRPGTKSGPSNWSNC